MPATRASTVRAHRRIDPTVGSRSLGVERQRVEGRLCSLQAVLPSGAFSRIFGGGRPCRKLGEGQRTNRDLLRKYVGRKDVEVHHHRRVKEAHRVAVSHGG